MVDACEAMTHVSLDVWDLLGKQDPGYTRARKLAQTTLADDICAIIAEFLVRICTDKTELTDIFGSAPSFIFASMKCYRHRHVTGLPIREHRPRVPVSLTDSRCSAPRTGCSAGELQKRFRSTHANKYELKFCLWL